MTLPNPSERLDMSSVFKCCIAVGVLLLGISATYYFAYALPQIQKQKLAVQLAAGNWERELQCSKRAEELFNASSWSEKNSGASYENHFNHRLDKCFILVKSMNSVGSTRNFSKTLLDVNDGKDLALWNKQVPSGVGDYAIKPDLCDILDKQCQTDEEFDAFVKFCLEK